MSKDDDRLHHAPSSICRLNSHRPRGAGIGVPYVESFPQQKMRELWEKCDFQVATSVVNGVIAGEGGGTASKEDDPKKKPPLLCPLQLPSLLSVQREEDSSLSGFEYMFDPLYKEDYQFAFSQNVSPPPDANDPLKSFCIRVAYRGDVFCGWQTQLNYERQPSVQKTLENYLEPLFVAAAAKKKSSNKDKTTKAANLPVAGRTDAGVHAIGQICRFRTHHQHVTAQGILEHLSESILQGPSASLLKVTDVVQVSRAFHPTFTTSSRAYVYLIDVPTTGFWSLEEDIDEKVAYLNVLLQEVEGKELNYFGLSYGKPQTQDFLCTLHHARARLVTCSQATAALGSGNTPDMGDKKEEALDKAICIELVGSRFLRRMVRLLVQASMSIIAQQWHHKEKMTLTKEDDDNNHCPISHLHLPRDAFLDLIRQCDRALLSRVSPPHGLLFVGARLMDV